MSFNILARLLRTKTPRVIQMDAVECGAAALAVVLAYYKRFVSLEELRLACGVSRDGVSAQAIIEAARHYGLDADGYQGGWKDLHELPTPAILYWDQNHFVVLEEIIGHKAYLNDPAVGPYSLTLEEVSRHFSNMAIVLSPAASFQRGGKDISLFAALRERFVTARTMLTFLLGLELFFVVLGLCMPALSKIFVDTFLIAGLPTWKKEFLYFIGGLSLATLCIAWLKGRFINRLQISVSMESSRRFVKHLFSLPLLFFSQRFPGELIQRIQLNSRIAELFAQGFLLNVVNILLVICYAAIFFTYNQLIAWIGILAALFNMGLLYAINRSRTNAYARLLQEDTKAVGLSLDVLENIETMKSVAKPSYFFTRLAGHYTNSINANQTIGKKDVWLFTFSGFAMDLTNALLLIVGSYVVMRGELTMGMLYAFQILMSSFLNPFRNLVEFGTKMQSFKVDLARIEDVLHCPQDPLTQLPYTPEEKMEGELEFCEVTFGYALLEEPLIQDFTVKIPKHQMIGMVGRVGSGKSTLAKLASALYKPWKGEIHYDGKPYSAFTRNTLKNSLAAVDQEIKLFKGTFFENISLWDPDVTEEMVIAAAKKAAIHEEITSLPLGYSAEVQEDGANLSQGQRQRLELARALLYNPRILILDEALNSVDSDNQSRILKGFKQSKMTVLLIAHRLSTLKQCDTILYIERGRLVAGGTHEYLLEHYQPYKDLCAKELIKG